VEIRRSLRNLMWEKVGIVRGQEELWEALTWVREREDLQLTTRNGLELQNMLHLSRIMIDGALIRKESRGAHYRSDYPHRDDVQWSRHVTFKKN